VDRPGHPGRRHRRVLAADACRRWQRPPGHGDLAGARGIPALSERHDPRPERPAVAGPRPVRPVLRALQPHAVHPALPLRLRPGTGDLKALRTWGSLTPGHPEVHHTAGVEITTGPARLGAGQRGRDGDGPAPPARACSTPTPRRAKARSTTTSTCWPPTATSWKASPTRPARLPGTRNSATSRSSTTRTRSPSRTTPTSRSARTSRRATRPTAGMSRPSTGAATADGATYVEDVDALLAAIDAGRPVTDKPTLVVLRTIIAWPSPTKQDTGKSHGSALGADEIAGSRRRSASTRPSPSRSPESLLTHARKVVRRAARPPTRSGTRGMPRGARPSPSGAALLDRLVAGSCPLGWPRRCRAGRPTPRGRHPGRVGQGPHGPGPRHARAVGRLGRPGRVQQHDDGGPAVVHPE
jgi:hypothetical protein